MVLCQVCETKVQEGGNYCHNCGVGVESLDHHYCQNCNIEIPVHSTQMASNELKPGANAQCSTRLMRFELSTEAFDFYGSAEVLRKRQEFYGRATFLRNSNDELDFYGRSSRLFPQNSYISKERSQICKERLQNSKETVIFLQNDTTFSSRSATVKFKCILQSHSCCPRAEYNST